LKKLKTAKEIKEIKVFFFDFFCADLVRAWLDLAKFGFGLESAPPQQPRSTC
jgi:hypothetical protein